MNFVYLFTTLDTRKSTSGKIQKWNLKCTIIFIYLLCQVSLQIYGPSFEYCNPSTFVRVSDENAKFTNLKYIYTFKLKIIGLGGEK